MKRRNNRNQSKMSHLQFKRNRLKLDMNQEEFAEKLNCVPSLISMKESGLAAITLVDEAIIKQLLTEHDERANANSV